MTRLILATCIAVALHVVIFLVGARFLSSRVNKLPELRPITVSLGYKEPEVPIAPTIKSLCTRPPRSASPKIKKAVKARFHKPRQVKRNKALKRPDKMAMVPASREKSLIHVKQKTDSILQQGPDNGITEKQALPEPVADHPPLKAIKQETISHETQVNEAANIDRTHKTTGEAAKVAKLAEPKGLGALVKEARPEYLKNAPPVYPLMAKRRGYEGTVILEVLITRHGKVKDLRIFHSSGHKILDKAAAKAVWKWIFEPGRRGNEPVEMWVKVPIKFKLK